jgi:hypothetical protein
MVIFLYSARLFLAEHEEAVLLAIVKDMEIPIDRRPLQCVTFKQPLPEYFDSRRYVSGGN